VRLGRLRTNLSYRRQLVLFLAPYLLGTLVLVVLPALATVTVSLTNYQAIGASHLGRTGQLSAAG